MVEHEMNNSGSRSAAAANASNRVPPQSSIGELIALIRSTRRACTWVIRRYPVRALGAVGVNAAVIGFFIGTVNQAPQQSHAAVPLSPPRIVGHGAGGSSITTLNDSAAHQPRRSAASESISTYRVRKNDSLHRIAMNLYGSIDDVEALYRINRETIGADPMLLKPDIVLRLPKPPTNTRWAAENADIPSQGSKVARRNGR